MNESTTTAVRPECGVCGAALGDGARLCRVDQRRLCKDLDELADYLITELETTRSRQDRIGTPGRGAPGYGDSPLAWNEHAAGVSDVVSSTVIAWALDCHHRDEDDRDPLGAVRGDDLIGITRWLRRAMPILRLHPEAELAHQQITSVAARGRRAVDLPRTASTFVVGPCPQQVGQDTSGGPSGPEKACEGTVRAYIGATDDQPSLMRCDACRHQWGTSEWLRAGRRILARSKQLGRIL